MNVIREPLFFLFTSLAIAGSAIAAQPAAKVEATTAGTRAQTGMTPLGPGSLKGFGVSIKTVTAGQPLAFTFDGSGPCRIKVNSGDGYVNEFDGVLPFKAAYTYGTGSMSSFEISKDYTPTATVTGNCKAVGTFAPVKVTVMNPAPQPAITPGTPTVQSAVSSTVNLKLKP